MSRNNEVKIEGRLVWIDILKGFLMCLVIWSHMQSFDSQIGVYFTTCYMGAYFFVSGYTMKTDNTSFNIEYIAKKAKRLLLPMFCYGFVLCVLKSFADGFSIQDLLFKWGRLSDNLPKGIGN